MSLNYTKQGTNTYENWGKVLETKLLSSHRGKKAAADTESQTNELADGSKISANHRESAYLLED